MAQETGSVGTNPGGTVGGPTSPDGTARPKVA
jgi:hypothetical protein